MTELQAYRDAQRFKDVHLAHWTGSVVLQPGVHAVLMKHMSKKQTHSSADLYCSR